MNCVLTQDCIGVIFGLSAYALLTSLLLGKRYAKRLPHSVHSVSVIVALSNVKGGVGHVKQNVFSAVCILMRSNIWSFDLMRFHCLPLACNYRSRLSTFHR